VSEELPPAADLRHACAQLPALRLLALENFETIGVAVSGGADSIYLLAALWAHPIYRNRLRVLHFNHRVRGVDADRDEAFVRNFSAALGVPCVVGRRADAGEASEWALREARNNFFAQQRQALGFKLICTAHHIDDVAETMLMRLARGAGLSGLSAPRVWQTLQDGHLRYRPLIAAGLSKKTILQQLTDAHLPWCEDATNALPIAWRNRIRAWLNSGAERVLGERYASGFAHSAQVIEQARQALLAWADELGADVVNGVMSAKALHARPRGLIHVALSRFLQHHGLGAASGRSVELLVDAIECGMEIQVSVLGRQVRVKQGVVRLVAEASVPFGSDLRNLKLGVLDDECGLLAEEVAVDASLWEKLSRGDIPPSREVYLSAAALGALTWRGRVEGDRYQPLGLNGVAKISDLLINRKIPLAQRETLPVVMLGGEILWVPSMPPAELYKLKGPTDRALRLTWLTPCLG
jgi:tRNA(Ile)-lysidine synthase